MVGLRDNLIIILAYNEESRIARTVLEFANFPVLVVADGDDSTADIAIACGASAIQSTRKRGYGQALKDGLHYAHNAGYKYGTIVDVGTCRASDVTNLYRGTDILARARSFELSGLRAALSLTAKHAVSFVSGSNVPDATFGFRTYRLEKIIPLLCKVRTNGYATNTELFLVALANDLFIEYVRVPYRSDNNGSMKLRDIVAAIKCLVRFIFGEMRYP